MRYSRVAAYLMLGVVATSCSDPESERSDPGSQRAIEALASMERSVEEIDVCEAIRDADAEDELGDIMGVDSVNLEGSYSESEDAFTQRCEVIAIGEPHMAVAFFQGTEFVRADLDDPVVFANCRVAQKPPAREFVTYAAVRATCGRGITVDIEPNGEAAIPPWTGQPDVKPTQEYVDLLRAVLVAISSQN